MSAKKQTSVKNETKKVEMVDVAKGYVEVSPSLLSIKFPSCKKIDHIVNLAVLYKLIKNFGFNFQLGELDFWSKSVDGGGQLIVISPTGTDEFQFEIDLVWYDFRDALYYFLF